MDEVKVYVVGNKDICVTCRNCGRTIPCRLSQIMSKNVIKIECECHNIFTTIVERRNFYRKSVKLLGMCYASGDPDEGTPIKIVDISRTGVGFIKYAGKPLLKDEVVKIKFRLSADSNVITITATVTNIKQDHTGVSMVNLDEHTQKLLGFFLLP